MAIVYMNIWCSQCKSDNVVSTYDEKENNIICGCMDCYYTSLLNDFDYLLDGDMYSEEDE